MKYVAGIAAAVILFAVWFVSGLNRVVRLDESVNSSFKEIENQMQRRYDLIPNLVSSVKGYAKHEKELFTSIADARARLAGGGKPEDKIKSFREMDGLLSRLLVVMENYPQLKANDSFMRLMDELSGTENRLAVSRMRYNDAVKIFNTHIREVVGGFFASRKKLNSPKPYYEIGKEARGEAPKVEF